MRVVLMMLAAAVLACGSPVQVTPPELQVISKGGPPVSIQINGLEVANVPCNGGVTLKPSSEGVPALPWNVRIIAQPAGRILLDERITELPRWLFVQRNSAGVSNSAISGPFVPCD